MVKTTYTQFLNIYFPHIPNERPRIRQSSYYDTKKIDKYFSKTPIENRLLIENAPLLKISSSKYKKLEKRKALNLSAGENYQKKLSKIISRGSHLLNESVESINFSNNKKITTKGFFGIMERCKNTSYLDISNTNLKAKNFNEKAFPNIKELTISGYNEKDLLSILKSFPNLIQINFVGDKKLDQGHIASILDKNEHIGHIRILNCYALESEQQISKIDKEDFFLEQFPTKRFYFHELII